MQSRILSADKDQLKLQETGSTGGINLVAGLPVQQGKNLIAAMICWVQRQPFGQADHVQVFIPQGVPEQTAKDRGRRQTVRAWAVFLPVGKIALFFI